MKKNRMRCARVLVAAMMLTAFAVAIAGCSSTPSSKADAPSEHDAKGNLTQLTFVLDYTPNTNHTGVYVASKLGYYAEEGLDVAVVQPPEDGSDAMVATGKAQLGISFQDIMANYLGSSTPLPVTAVAAVVQHNTSGIMSRAEDGIESPADMAGKRYATWDQDVEKAMIRTVVEADGGNYDDVQLIPAGLSDEVGGLRANEFDAVWIFEAWAGQNAAVQNYPVNYFSFREIDERFDYYTPVIIANDEFLKESPDVARAFLRATARGYQYAIEHPDEAAQLMIEAVPEMDEELARASQDYLTDKYVADAPYWGYIDAARWNAFYQWMNDESLTEVSVPLNTAFTNDYLPQS